MRAFIFSKKTLAILAAFVILAVGIWVLVAKNKDQTQSFEFSGLIEKVEANTVYVNGSYFADGKPVTAPATVRIQVSDKTKLEKNLWYMPTAQELQTTGGRWTPDSIKKETAVGTFDDFKSERGVGMQIHVKSNDNVFNKPKFTADNISYVEEVVQRSTTPYQSQSVIVQ